MTDDLTRNAAVRAIVLKFEEFAQSWAQADNQETVGRQMIEAAKAAKKAADAKYKECLAAARLFDFDLQKEWTAYREAQPEMFDPQAEKPTVPEPMEPEPDQRTIKERVLDAARAAHPHPVRASGLRNLLEQQGVKTHEKTIGMTLYRLLKDGKVRRDGWDWFYAPGPDEQVVVAEPSLLDEPHGGGQ